MNFTELGLSAKVLAAIEASGYTTPTPIQAKAIPVALSGCDVLGIAQTGTGKTASFVLPMLTRLETGRARARMPRSLILAPTRELAAQVADHFERYGANHKLTLALIIGGVSFEDQDRKLDRGVDVLIATPGRLLDHFQRGKLLLTGVEILVIDEADRMLDMGFIPDIERICSLLPPRRQTLFFSATMPAEIQRLVDRFLRSPERVEAAPPATTASTITQRFQFASPDPKMKRQALRDWIRAEPVKNAIIFCNRKRDVDILYKSLAKHGFNVGCLHGDMDQRHRTATLDAFRNGTLTLLAASDVAARGLDIPEVSHVFNFDVPIAAEDYVHRIGRTGRAGRSGFSATLVTDDDMRTLRDIERMLKASVEWVGAPPPEDAGTKSGRRKRLAEAGTGRDERRDGRRGRGEGRGSRPPRHSGDHPRRRETAPELALPAALVPADAQPEIAFWPATEIAPPRERREPRRDRAKHAHSGDDSPSGEPRERRPRHHAETADAQPREERGPRPRRPQRQPQPERERVVGMGSHVPAFMRRPPRGTPGGRD